MTLKDITLGITDSRVLSALDFISRGRTHKKPIQRYIVPKFCALGTLDRILGYLAEEGLIEKTEPKRRGKKSYYEITRNGESALRNAQSLVGPILQGRTPIGLVRTELTDEFIELKGKEARLTREYVDKLFKDPKATEEVGTVIGSAIVAFRRFDMQNNSSYTGSFLKDGRVSFFGIMTREEADRLKDLFNSGRFDEDEKRAFVNDLFRIMYTLGYWDLVHLFEALKNHNFTKGEIAVNFNTLIVDKESGKIRLTSKEDVDEYTLLQKIREKVSGGIS